MQRTAAVVLGVIVMVGLIVGVDIAFLRDHGAVRLVVNVAIVAAFAFGT